MKFTMLSFDEPVPALNGLTARDVFKTTAAYELATTLIEVSNVWDDLIDRELVAGSTINAAFFACLISIPRNPFYRQYADRLQPLMECAIFQFLCSNRWENDRDEHGLELGHVMRYGIAAVIAQIILIVHDAEFALSLLPALYKALCGERFEEYRSEIMNRGVANG